MNQTSIRSFLIILVAGVALTMTGILVTVAVNDARDSFQMTEDRSRDVASLIAGSVNRFLEDVDTLAGALATRGAAVLRDDRGCEDWRNIGLDIFDRFTNAVLLDSTGLVRCSFLDARVEDSLSYADRPWFHSVISTGRFTVSEPTIGRQSRQWSMAMAHAVLDDDGTTVLGAAAIGINLADLQEILDAAVLPENMTATISSPKWAVIARTRDPEEWIGRRLPGDTVAERRQGPHSGYIRAVSGEGQPMAFAFVDIVNVGWRVFAGVEESYATAPVLAGLRRNLLMALIGLTVVGLLSFTVYRRINRSLTELLAETRAALLERKGHVEIDGPAEMVAVARQFDRMLAAWKEAEAAHIKLSHAMDQLDDPVVITDAAGSVEYVNPGFEQVSGYSAEEVLGQSLRVLKSGQHDRAFYANLWDTITSGHIFRGGFINRSKTGRLYTEEVTITPLRNDDGVITHFISTGRDVTEQERLEARLRRAEKLEAVGQLAGGIAHDFNNILTAIRGHSELLGSMLGADADEDIEESIQEIVKGTEMAASLTGQLLAFSKKHISQVEAVDLNATVRKVEAFLRRVFPADVRLLLTLDANAGHVELEASHAEQIILNLALNAQDALGERGGELAIRTSQGPPPDDWPQKESAKHVHTVVTLEVSDSGRGMTPETLERIFDPFFTTKEQGSGLGLATVYGIVEAAGGTIDARSALGQGTVITIRLPQVPAPTVSKVAASKGAEVTRLGGSETILVAEDSASVRRLIAETLRQEGYEILQAGDGRSALELARRHDGPIHALVSDVMMPEMRGPDLYREMQVDRPALRAVFISGYTGAGTGALDVGQAGVRFLQKPFGPVDLKTEVRRALDAKTVLEFPTADR
ncbi:MAG: ATP-binding protein [Gemmatimonadota bacterium]|nr:ATP-binding protein [Gemmatimonadota bacterium]